MSEPIADNAQDDERSELELGVAEQLALLSQSSEVPYEFEAPGNSFGADDVDFSSSGWMSSLTTVQGWLRLREPLEMSSPPDFLKALARGLGIAEPDEAIELVDQQPPRLSHAGLTGLSERAERAVELQKTFIEDLEAEGGTVTAATGRWIEAWEEAPEEEEGGSSGPVTATTHVWNIDYFRSRAERGRLNLSPSYQRGDVWPMKDYQMLIESILRGIPLPSVILLKPHEVDTPYEVVDGKQRLTAILRFIGRHPLALDRVKSVAAKHDRTDLLPLFKDDYPAFRKLWKNLGEEPLTASKEQKFYFPFKLRSGVKPLEGELTTLQGKYYTQIKSLPIKIANESAEIWQIFEDDSPYKIPLIEYSSATPRQIHEVFNLYNKQGKHLNAEEIRNAVYHSVEFVRGLLVAAGDSAPMNDVAPFLAPAWSEIREIQEVLADYKFGSSRYKQTKVLSWLSSLLLLDSPDKDGRPRTLSTARQIDALLRRIEEDANDPLRDAATIRDAFLLMCQGMRAHAAVDEAWSPSFKDAKHGAKWQELQLVASLLGVTISASVLGESTEEHLETAAQALRAKTATPDWRRPIKTQTATQWEYIARIALLTVEELGVDPDAASKVMIERFGYSGVNTLKAVRDNARSK